MNLRRELLDLDGRLTGAISQLRRLLALTGKFEHPKYRSMILRLLSNALRQFRFLEGRRKAILEQLPEDSP